MLPTNGPRDTRLQTLADAIRAVTAAASQDPGAVLEELRRQAEGLLAADAAGIHVVERLDGDLAFRRLHVSTYAARRGATESPPWRPDASMLRPLEAGQALFYADFPATVPFDLTDRPWLRDFASALYAPIAAHDELFGVLFAGWFQARPPSGQLLTRAEALGGCAAVAIRTARLLASERAAREEAERSSTEASAVVEATRLVWASADHDLGATLDALADQARQLVEGDDVSVVLATGKPGEFVRSRPSVLAAANSEVSVAGSTYQLDGNAGQALAQRRPIATDDFQRDPTIAQIAREALPGVSAAITVPLLVNDEAVGLMRILWLRPHRTTSREIAMVEAFGRHAAIAIRTARLRDDTRRARQLVTEAEDRQRREIAELLHSRVQTRLLIVWHRLGRLAAGLPGEAAAARAEMSALREEIEEIRESGVRQATHLLHPSVIGLGLGAAVQSLASRLGDSLAVTVQSTPALAVLDDPVQNRLPEAVRLTAYRVIEEALANVQRHASAQRVQVRLDTPRAGMLAVRVRDDGGGFDRSAMKPGLGVTSMAARVGEAGGR